MLTRTHLAPPKFSRGAAVRSQITGQRCTVEVVTEEAHPKTGERIYLVMPDRGRPQRVQERNLRFQINGRP